MILRVSERAGALNGNISWQRAVGGLFVLLLVFWVLLGCASQGSNGTDAVNSSEPREPESMKTTAAPSEYAVGDTAYIDDVSLKVNEVEHNYSPSSSSLSPAPGDEFIRVNVTFSNRGSSTQPYNEYAYEVKDSQGLRRSVSLIPVSEAFTIGTVAPGSAVAGNMVFDVPQGDSDLKLIVGKGGFNR